jgi:hypothetical protein
MRKLFTAAFAIVLVTTLASGPVWAKSGWDFKLYSAVVINGTGTVLEPGSYELRLNGNSEAAIYRNRKLVTTVPVEVRSLDKGTDPKSMLIRNGVIVEIRTRKEVVVFSPRS